MKFARIYVLLTQDDHVFYVGETTNERNRFSSHKLRFGDDIKMELIDEVLYDSRLWWESHYIDLYSSWGFSLKNRIRGRKSRPPGKNELILLEKYKISEAQTQKTKNEITAYKSMVALLKKENKFLLDEISSFKNFELGNIYAVKGSVLMIAIDEVKSTKTAADIDVAIKELEKLKKYYHERHNECHPSAGIELSHRYRLMY